MYSESTLATSLVNFKGFIRAEVRFATGGTLKRVANLVLGAKMADESDLALEYLEAHLTDELQTYTNRTYKHRHDVTDRIIYM